MGSAHLNARPTLLATLMRLADVALRLTRLVADSAISTKLDRKKRSSLAHAMRAISMATPFATLYSEYALWLTSLEDGPDNAMALCSCMRRWLLSCIVSCFLVGMLGNATRNTLLHIRCLATRACFSQGWHKII